MNHFSRLQAFAELCHGSAVSVESIEAGFRTTLEEMGFRYYACCSHVDPLDHPVHAVVLQNYPIAWVRHFSDARLHRIDPVLQQADGQGEPFFWDATFSSHPLTEAQKKVLAEAALLGLAHGYTVPIEASWIPGSLRASCSVIPDSGKIRPRCYFTVEVMAQYLYASVACARRARSSGSIPRATELSPRERECLALAAQGKDDWTIGHLLSLSENTVHSYIEHIKRRFRVHTRVQAVVQGVMTGQISLGDVARK